LPADRTQFYPVFRFEQMRARMLNVISIVYNEQGILFVGAGFHSGLLCFYPALRSIGVTSTRTEFDVSRS
jgi:hypothetical protein